MVNQGIGERLDNFDVAQFFAIFLVVWGHVIHQSCMLKNPLDVFICQTIYTFHMPLFMGLCGFFFHKSIAKFDSIDDYIHCKLKRRLISLVLPMLSFGFVKTILSGNYSMMNYLLQAKGIWFLGVLAINTVAVLCILKCKSNPKAHNLYLYGLFVISIVLQAILYTGSGVFMFVFFCAGFFASKNSCDIKTSNKLLLTAVIAYVIFDIAYNNMPGGRSPFIINFVRYSLPNLIMLDCVKMILGFLGSYIFLSVIRKIDWENTNIYQYVLLRGRYTLDIYLLNIIVLEIFLVGLYKKIVSIYQVNIFYEYGFLWDLLSTFVISVLITELLFKIGQAMRKNRIIRAVFFATK